MSVERITLEDIDLSRLTLWREIVSLRGAEDHSRWVFLSEAGPEPIILKLWNPTYVRRDNILDGLESGLYTPEVTPGLWGVVLHKGVCRGYAMRRCRPNRRISPPFIRALWERTRESGRFACQYRSSHVMTCDAGVTLIDLEGVFPIAGLLELPEGVARIEDPDYEAFVKALHAGSLSLEETRTRASRHCAALAARRGPSLATGASWAIRKADGARRRVGRRLRRWRRDSRSLIEI